MNHPTLPRVPIGRRTLVGLLAGTAALAAGVSAEAQTAWPTRPVTIVVPFPAGGGHRRVRAAAVRADDEERRQTVHHRQQGGAGGGWWAPASRPKAAPDVTPSSWARCTMPSRRRSTKLDYNLETDFIPVGLIGAVPQVIVVNPQRVPVNDLQGLLAYMRRTRAS